jgi:cytochrome c
MGNRQVHLVYGTLSLLAIYIIGNVAFRLEVSRRAHDPQTIALVQHGQQVAENCVACHYMDQRTHFVGPHLVGLIGRPIGSASGYEYSAALKKMTGVWTEDRLTAFLSHPQEVAPGTKMALAGWPTDDVLALIAYLQSKE